MNQFAAGHNANFFMSERLRNFFFRAFLYIHKKERFAEKNITKFKEWIFAKELI